MRNRDIGSSEPTLGSVTRTRFGRALVVFAALAIAGLPAGGLRAEWEKWSKRERESIESSEGIVISSAGWGYGTHLKQIRGRFEELGVKTCLVTGVRHRDEYASAVDSYDPDGDGPEEKVWKWCIYSLTHGGCKALGALKRHEFHCLTLTSDFDPNAILLHKIPETKRVYPEDLPEDMAYLFAIVTACHSGDQVGSGKATALYEAIADPEGYEEIPVYVACKGGENDPGRPGCEGCVSPTASKRFTEQFMAVVVDLRENDPKAVFSDAFDEVEEDHSEHFRFMSGSNEAIRGIFPL